MMRLSGGGLSTLLFLVCTYVLALVSYGCQGKESEKSCLTVGEGLGAPINGGMFLEELIDIYGQKFSREFMRRRVIERKAEALKVALPKGQVDSEMILTERDFFASHSGEKAPSPRLRALSKGRPSNQSSRHLKIKYANA
jgi:hypothetical protein